MSPSVLRTVSFSLAFLLAAGCTTTQHPPLQSPWTGNSDFPTDSEPVGDDDEDEEVPADHAEICVRKTTLVRTADQPCDDDQKGHAWYYVPVTSKVPALGKRTKAGSFKVPDADTYRATKKGGKGDQVLIADDRDRVEICVRERTRTRVTDEHCDDEEDGYRLYFFLLKQQIPAVGRKAVNGSFYSTYLADTFKARRSGGKGSQSAIRPQTDDGDTGDSIDTGDRRTNRQSTTRSTTTNPGRSTTSRGGRR